MNDTIKNIIGGVAPALATALGGPLAGAAVSSIASKVLGNPDASADEVASALAGPMTPELRAKIVDAETTLKIESRKLDTEDRRIDADVEKRYLDDVNDARKAHGHDRDIMVMGASVLIGWLLITGATLFGLYEILIGGIKVVDVGIVATVFTVLGSTVGYVSNSAQQVLSYYFGSSRGSAQKTAGMISAIAGAGKH